MNKNKIKNIALGVSLGLNILLGFFLGGGLISSCTAKKAINPTSSVSTDASGKIIDGLQKRGLNPLLAADDNIDPADYPNLWDTSSPNYVVGASGFTYLTEDNTYHFSGRSGSLTYYLKLTDSGLYWFERVRGADTWGDNVLISQTEFDYQMTAPSGYDYVPLGVAYNKDYFYVTPAMVTNGVYLAVGSSNGLTVSPVVYLIKGDDLPASEVVTFPREFFPWQIWGDRASDVLISGPSVTSSTTAETQVVMFNNLLFRSAGRIYKGIWLSFKFAPGTYLGKYIAGSGEIYANGRIVYSTANPPWYLSQMVYLPADGSNGDIALTANFAQASDTLLLMPNPIWARNDFRKLEVLSYEHASMSNVPSRVGSNSPREWLNVLAQVEIITTTSGGDPFTLLSNGFTAVANILSIPILPFLTLGTLIFVPLIVLVILAILRLLAK